MWDIDYGFIENWLDSLDDKTVAHIFARSKSWKQTVPHSDVLSSTRWKDRSTAT